MLLAGNRSQVLKTTPPRKQHRSSRSAKHHQRLAVVLRAYTQLAQQAIRHSQLEACRQGSLFLAPPHLLQGLLDTEGCRACELLNAAGLSAAAAEAVLVDPTMVPTSSSLSAGDLYFAPDAQKALRMAADASQAAGKQAAGTPHLLLGLLDCGNAAVNKALDRAGVELSHLRGQVEAAASTCDEPVSPSQQPAAANAQAAALVQQYKQWVAQHGSEAPASGGGWRPAPAQPPARTAADDDIYE